MGWGVGLWSEIHTYTPEVHATQPQSQFKCGWQTNSADNKTDRVQNRPAKASRIGSPGGISLRGVVSCVLEGTLTQDWEGLGRRSGKPPIVHG